MELLERLTLRAENTARGTAHRQDIPVSITGVRDEQYPIWREKHEGDSHHDHFLS
jgi:hypothetical protein